MTSRNYESTKAQDVVFVAATGARAKVPASAVTSLAMSRSFLQFFFLACAFVAPMYFGDAPPSETWQLADYGYLGFYLLGAAAVWLWIYVFGALSAKLARRNPVQIVFVPICTVVALGIITLVYQAATVSLTENLIKNGDFSRGFDGGWRTNGDATTVFSEGVAQFNAGNSENAGASIEQTIPTRVGAKYEVTLQMFETGKGNGSHTFMIDILDPSGEIVARKQTVVENQVSREERFDFVATSANSLLVITNTGFTTSHASDGVIDNVVVLRAGDGFGAKFAYLCFLLLALEFLFVRFVLRSSFATQPSAARVVTGSATALGAEKDDLPAAAPLLPVQSSAHDSGAGEARPTAFALGASESVGTNVLRIARTQVFLDQVVYAKSEDHYLRFYYQDGQETLIRVKLSAFEEQAKGRFGLRINRSTWIAFRAIREVRDDEAGLYVETTNGHVEKVAESRRIAFLGAFEAFNQQFESAVT